MLDIPCGADHINHFTAGFINGAPITNTGRDRQNAGGGAGGGAEGAAAGGRGDDFSHVSGDQLGTSIGAHHLMCVMIHAILFPGEDDLVDVVEEIIDVASKWRPLGLALRLKVAELDTISSKNHTDPTECLRDMLLAWLQQRYDTKKFGPPSWRMLCQAIAKAAGGNNPALAKKIAEHHTS